MCEKGTCVSSFAEQQDSLIRKASRNFRIPNFVKRKGRKNIVRAYTATA